MSTKTTAKRLSYQEREALFEESLKKTSEERLKLLDEVCPPREWPSSIPGPLGGVSVDDRPARALIRKEAITQAEKVQSTQGPFDSDEDLRVSIFIDKAYRRGQEPLIRKNRCFEFNFKLVTPVTDVLHCKPEGLEIRSASIPAAYCHKRDDLVFHLTGI